MYLKDFFNKYNNKKVTNQGKSQCVALFRQFCDDVLQCGQPEPSYTGFKDRGGRHFYENFETDNILKNNFIKIANTPTFIPQQGDVAVFNMGIYGHISICTGKGTISEFESFDQNYPTNCPCHFQVHNYKQFYGVLRPKNQSKINKYTVGQNVTCSTRYPQSNSNLNEVEHLSLYKQGTIAFIEEGSKNPYLIQFDDKQAWCNAGDIRN